MHTITCRNVNEALPAGLAHLRANGIRRDSRNGPVLAAPTPVTTVYRLPWERVLFSPERDCNPFFHLVEAVWMLAGRDDVETVARYAKQMNAYTDNGLYFWGAYGYRWRKWFDRDQLLWAINRLKTDPSDRRVVIGMWDPYADPGKADADGKDIPCNTHIYVWIDHEGRLSLTVCCRSNDIIWGAHGANAVHFSVLQEFLASSLGRPMGPLYQVSNNYHAYVDLLDKYGDCASGTLSGYPESEPMAVLDPAQFLQECELLLLPSTDLSTYRPTNWWLKDTVLPAMRAHQYYKDKDYTRALNATSAIASDDWSEACYKWLQRRQAAYLRAQDDGPSHE